PGLERDVPTVAMMNWIVARADLEPGVVRLLLDVLDGRRKELVATTDIARQIDLARLADAPIPLHPAAEEWMRDH
ncbi:MAG: TAXI family TRAP transporter solute-binding subunit, partial [Gemmatimonadota bacterium]